MPFRPDFWNVPLWSIALMYVLLAASVLAMVAQLWTRIRLWRVGRPDPRFDHLMYRFARLAKYGFAQVKITNQAYAGVMHLSIFWAMVVLFIGTVLATIDTDFVELVKLMKELYAAILDVIEGKNYDVTERASVTTSKKLYLFIKVASTCPYVWPVVRP